MDVLYHEILLDVDINYIFVCLLFIKFILTFTYKDIYFDCSIINKNMANI